MMAFSGTVVAIEGNTPNSPHPQCFYEIVLHELSFLYIAHRVTNGTRRNGRNGSVKLFGKTRTSLARSR